jgi:pyruvate dehydrogenase E2 component (dihydrolipoamide acetyltransferase)
MAIQKITVPDIGGDEGVDLIEVCVAVGDDISADDPIVVLESDKASMDVPSPESGKVTAIHIKEGDKVSEGDLLIEIETAGGEATAETPVVESAPAPAPAAAPAAASAEMPVNVPDIGGSENVDVIELCVAVGDEVAEGDALIVLESDKASMDVPSPAAGTVLSIVLKEGDKVSEGSAILVLSSGAVVEAPAAAPPPVAEVSAAATASSAEMDVVVPDIGGAEGVDVIEVSIAVGDEVAEGDAIIVLESDKASMDVPAPASGKVLSIAVNEGSKVSQGDLILKLETAASAAPAPVASAPAPAAAAPAPATPAPAAAKPQRTVEKVGEAPKSSGSEVYAGPAARKLAREMSVDLALVAGSGPRGRISKDDIKQYVKSVMEGTAAAPSVSGTSAAGVVGGSGIPAVPEVDYSKFGEIDIEPMNKIKKLTADAMSRNWLNIPRVTQFDDVDITELEAFRKGMKAEAEKSGVKLTPLPFLIKAAAAALVAEPSFNVAITADGASIVHKKFVHIAIAVDTPRGLMVPVIKDADKKGIFQIARETIELAGKARDGKLKPAEMQGGCFTISSLGAIGGTGFTPIVSTTEAGILGVSKAAMKPVWDGKAFQPRMMLPVCLSYDHRAVNGSDAGRFLTYYTQVLSDIRKLLL